MLGTTLDAATGLVFVFMLFSLFLSTALEAVASMLGLRARALEITIAQLIQDPDKSPRFAHLPFKGAFGLFDWLLRKPPHDQLRAEPVDPGDAERHEAATEFAADIVPTEPLRLAQVYDHPMVMAIPGKRPSYVPAASFASAVIALLARGGEQGLSSDVERGVAALPAGRMREAMATVIDEAQGDIARLRSGLERWYDNAMDRLSGEYKRFSQAATFTAALLLALGFHLDAVKIGERLYANAALRGAVAAMATDYVDRNALRVQEAADIARGTPEDADRKAAALATARDNLVGTLSPFGDLGRPSLIGLLVTALAGMLGAPFWFDLLQKFVNLRNTGPKPAAKTKAAQ